MTTLSHPAPAPPAPDYPHAARAAIHPTSPAWPKTSHPLSIAILGWARLSAQGREGSGYNLSASELARGLALSGHRVSYLSSGMTYRLRLAGTRTPHVVHREQWGGVSCHEIRNAPNLSPAAMNFRNMKEEIASPSTTRHVLRWLDAVDAQVVHVHSLEGFGLDLIGAVEASGRPVIITPHNYWYACPQVDLLYQERSVCVDYEGGNRCENCLPGKDPASAARLRAFGQSLESRLGMFRADVVRKSIYGIAPMLRSAITGRIFSKAPNPPLHPDAINDPELAAGFDTESARTSPTRADTAIHHNLTIAQAELPKDYEPSPPDQNQRVLNNADRHLIVLNTYGQRRAAGIKALSCASLITPPSEYLRKVHIAMGVPEAKIRRVLLGQPHFDQLNRRTRRSPFYASRPWDPSTASRPLRFAFFGTTRPNKGLEVLARAIPLIAPELRARCQIIIRAQGWDWPFRKRLAMYPEVSVWGGYDLYQLLSSVGEYDVGILSHIWLENSPLVLLENLHAGKFVICSKLGGPVDWIVEPTPSNPGNGLLFPGGDPHALARCIERCILGEAVIPSAKEVHSISTLQSYPAHVQEVEGIYRQALAAKTRTANNTAAAR